MQIEDEGNGNGNTKYDEFEERVKQQFTNGVTKEDDIIYQKQKSDELFMAAQNPLIMRNLLIIIDATKSSKITDFKPSRLAVILKHLPAFIEQFLEQNPLSQIGIACAEEYKCRTILNFTSSSNNIKQYLSTIKSLSEAGFSLAACLQTALYMFSSTQLHAYSSILILTSSTYSDDRLDLLDWSAQSQESAIQINVISFAGVLSQMFKISQYSEGQYHCPLNEIQYQQQLQNFVIPQAIKSNKQITQLVKIGFPIKLIDNKPTLCQCHLEIVYNYYKCPVCLSKVCSPPLLCPLCSTWIILPHQILRNEGLHSLDVFLQINDGLNHQCFGCQQDTTVIHSQCQRCNNFYCLECDILIHSNLKVCPGCS